MNQNQLGIVVFTLLIYFVTLFIVYAAEYDEKFVPVDNRPINDGQSSYNEDSHNMGKVVLGASNKSHEKTLIQMLINNYQDWGLIGRPVRNSSEVVEIKFGLAIIQILDLDENKQLLRTNCWLRYSWKDPLLDWKSWNNSNFENLTQVRVFPDQIWTPDIRLYNFADERLQERREARVVVMNDGGVLWVPQSLFKSTCAVEIQYFPYDTQMCIMEFGSWTYDITQLNLTWRDYEVEVGEYETNPYIDFNDYIMSNEWATDGEVEAKVRPSHRKLQIRSQIKCRKVRERGLGGVMIDKTYKILEYRLTMRRNPDFYLSILVLPCILLSCLTWVIFWLPPESPAKMMLGMNIFVAFFVLMLLLAETTPSAVSTFPLIGFYYCLNMIMITMSTFLAAIVLNLYLRADRKGPMHPVIRTLIVEGLGRLYLVRQNIPLPQANKTQKIKLFTTTTVSSNNGGRVKSSKKTISRLTTVPELKYNKFEANNDINNVEMHRNNSNGKNKHSNEVDPEDSPLMLGSVGAVEKDVREVKRYMRMYLSRLKEKERKNISSMEWRTFALVLDRLFFTVYVLSIITALITLIPRNHPKILGTEVGNDIVDC